MVFTFYAVSLQKFERRNYNIMSIQEFRYNGKKIEFHSEQ